MRVLVLCDDIWHPAEVPQNGLAPLVQSGFSFDWITDTRDWSSELMSHYPAAILAKANQISAADQAPWMTAAVQRSFLDYVQGGCGLLVLHSGTAGYENAKILRGLMGGVFREHPEQCPVTVEPRGAHPISQSSESFTGVDEHYFMDLDDPQAEVFMTTTSEHGSQPGGWTRMEGRGRVCVMTPGHNLEIWLRPAYQALIANALRWCAAPAR